MSIIYSLQMKSIVTISSKNHDKLKALGMDANYSYQIIGMGANDENKQFFRIRNPWLGESEDLKAAWDDQKSEWHADEPDETCC